MLSAGRGLRFDHLPLPHRLGGVAAPSAPVKAKAAANIGQERAKTAMELGPPAMRCLGPRARDGEMLGRRRARVMTGGGRSLAAGA